MSGTAWGLKKVAGGKYLFAAFMVERKLAGYLFQRMQFKAGTKTFVGKMQGYHTTFGVAKGQLLVTIKIVVHNSGTNIMFFEKSPDGGGRVLFLMFVEMGKENRNAQEIVQLSKAEHVHSDD